MRIISSLRFGRVDSIPDPTSILERFTKVELSACILNGLRLLHTADVGLDHSGLLLLLLLLLLAKYTIASAVGRLLVAGVATLSPTRLVRITGFLELVDVRLEVCIGVDTLILGGRSRIKNVRG